MYTHVLWGWQKAIAAVGVTACALALLIFSTNQADAALVDQVNEAIRKAGAPTTVVRSNTFQAAVDKGLYKTFSQLVGAIAFHKNKGTLPDVATIKKEVPKTCLNDATIVSISGDATKGGANGTLTVTADVKGVPTEYAIKLAWNQYKHAQILGLVAGSIVDKVCTTDKFKTLHGHLLPNK